jgi:phage baseplate assembly protein W
LKEDIVVAHIMVADIVHMNQEDKKEIQKSKKKTQIHNLGFIFITISSFIIFIDMAKYGIDFPFRDSPKGDFLNMTETPEREVRANLIHLILTRKGSRYYLPDFGKRIYEYIFDQNDMVAWSLIEEEIREAVRKYIPNLDINSINVLSAEDDPDSVQSVDELEDERLFRISDYSTKPYTAKVKIDYTVNNGAFSTSDFIIINI